MKFLSVCSGIEAASVAWKPLGWQAVAFSEIEKFPSAVLTHHYPTVPNRGDMTRFKEWPDAEVDVLVGGTPCQSFSVAGLRKGLDDPRGNLALTYLAIAAKYRPRWLVWENVPGVLSSSGGRDFGSFLGGLGELGYGFSYRVLDAQFFGVAQRRRRVFVVGHLGDWRRAAAVLFERESLSGHPAPSREAGEGIAVCPTLRAGGNRTGGDRPPGTDVDTADSLIAMCLNAKGGAGRMDAESETLIAFPWQVGGSQGMSVDFDVSGTLVKNQTQAVAFTVSEQANGFAWEREFAPTLDAQIPNDTSNIQKGVRIGSAVRRLTPRECERLQGFPDDYSLIPYRRKPAADGPRYKALGNSMAVPVMAWIGRRIAMADALQTSFLEAAE